MKVEFVSSFAVVTADPPTSRKLYVGALGLPLEADDTGDYYSSGAIEGSKHSGRVRMPRWIRVRRISVPETRVPGTTAIASRRR